MAEDGALRDTAASLLQAAVALRQAIEADQRLRNSRAEHEDLRDTVARLKRRVLELKRRVLELLERAKRNGHDPV